MATDDREAPALCGASFNVNETVFSVLRWPMFGFRDPLKVKQENLKSEAGRGLPRTLCSRRMLEPV